MPTTTVPKRASFIVVAALVVALAGCGVDADTVADALPDQTAPTTVDSTTTEAPSTTAESTTTEAPTTTDPSTTAPATTPPSTGGGAIPEEARVAFMTECQAGGQPEESCACIWDAIAGDLDVETLMEAGSSGTVPPELQEKIVDATMECLLGSE